MSETYTASTHPRWGHVVVGSRRGIVSRHPDADTAAAAAREGNGCRICGQRRPHRADCPAYGTEDLPTYYGEDDSEQDSDR